MIFSFVMYWVLIVVLLGVGGVCVALVRDALFWPPKSPLAAFCFSMGALVVFAMAGAMLADALVGNVVW